MSASVIRYRKLVTTDVASQAVNLAESGTMGHRVQIPMSVDDMNSFFVWNRPAGSDRAVGHFNADGGSISFDEALSYALSRTYNDVDGVTNGLNFSSAILDANTDSRVRKGGSVMANDIVMCYVIYKCYGSSSAPTEGVVYNLQDAHDMLSNGALVSAIHGSLSQEETLTNVPGVDKGAVDAMFRDLLAADPSRFFDSAGKQIPGLFEVNADTDSRGSWGFVQNDKIEIAVQMKFLNPVTRRGTDNTEEDSETVVIAAGSVFKIRLQIVATDTPSGAAAKQEVAKTELAMTIAEQAAATAKAAANAAAAQRTAAQAVAAAAAQTTAAQDRYTRAVDTNKKQAAAAAKALAASKAAQAALQLAITTGKKETEIQAQRAAAVAAAALADNLQAIADLAAADLQTAKNLADTAAAALAAAQTQAATALATVAAANAAAAKAAVMKADQEAADAAAAKAAADAASDPLTKKITDAEKVVLDPQTLVTLDAKLNEVKAERAAVTVTADKAYADLIESSRKYDTARTNLEYAISVGKKAEDIQIFKAVAVSALSAKEKANLKAQATLSTLTSYYNLELGALQLTDKAKVDSATLSSSVAAAGVNDATRKVNIATTAYTYASTVTGDALVSVAEAQATLDARISGGAVFTEVQTRRKAVLDANSILAASKLKSDAAAAALADAQKALVAANAAAATASATITVVGATAANAETFYQSTITSAKTYFSQKTADANNNENSLKAAALLTALNSAKDMVAAADSAYVVSKRNFDVAISSGKRLPEVTSLRQISQDAQLQQQRAGLILEKAQKEFDSYASSLKESVSSIMGSAAEFQVAQIESARINSLASIYNSTYMYYADVKAELDVAKAQDELAKSRLENATKGGSTLSEIGLLRQLKVKASSNYAAALAKHKSAASALLIAKAGGRGEASSQIFTTIAGTPGISGSADGNTKEGAVFNSLNNITFGPDGNIYVADTNNHLIRKVTPAGIVTTIAGNPGVYGFVDGTGTAAQFYNPQALAFGPDGNIYVSDSANNCIRKVTPAGVVTTLAGSGVASSADGTGPAAAFANPQGLAVGPDGNIYVADQNNHLIRKVTPAGIVTTLAGNPALGVYGDGTGTNAMFWSPSGLAFGPDGNMYVVDLNNHAIRKVTLEGVVTTFAGMPGVSGAADGTGTDAQFSYPRGLAVDASGNIYVADTNNHLIRKVTPEGIVTTISGNPGVGGYADGTGTDAKFYVPHGVAVAANGDIYVADTGSNLIRKVTIEGVVTRFAGSPGTYGHADGDGNIIRAGFTDIRDFVIVQNGDMYVAETANHSIRKVTPAGIITTIAGNPGVYGFVDGTGTAAQFNSPQAFAFDASGDIYVADSGNHCIRKVTPGGIVTTLAGSGIGAYADGTGTDAIFHYPTGLVFGPDGNMYVADQFNNRIRKVTPEGVVTTFAGSGDYAYVDGTGTAASFAYPYSLVFGPDGSMYVSDQYNHLIRKVTPAGVVTTVAGSGVPGAADGIGNDAYFNYPTKLAIASNGDIYIAEQNNNFIRKVTPFGLVTTVAATYPVALSIYSDILYTSDGPVVRSITGSRSFATTSITDYTSSIAIVQTTNVIAGIPNYPGFSDGSARGAVFNGLSDIKIGPDGNFYVADSVNYCIRKVTPAGIVTTFAGFPGNSGFYNDIGTNATFNSPQALAFGPDGNMYVADMGNHAIRKVTPAGVVTTLAGVGIAGSNDGTAGQAYFNTPQGLAVGQDGNIYVADRNNHCIRKVTPGGDVTTFAGGTAGYADGIGTNAEFAFPNNLVIASNGDIYVADTNNSAIRKISSGNVTTVAGVGGSAGYADGTGTDAQFNNPYGLAIGPDGNIYVADTGSSIIRKVTPAGVVTTVAGNPGTYSFVDGTGTDAQFNSPFGLTVAANGDIYVADTSNHSIRKITPAGVVTRFAGSPGVPGHADGGSGIAAQFNYIQQFIIAQNGDMYVADGSNYCIRKITPGGVVTTLAGSGVSGYADGTGTTAQFGYLSGLAIGPDGNIYVADQGNQVIRKVTTSGVVTTVAGNPGVGAYADGTGTAANFWNPVSISFGPDGNMYISDNANHSIRKVTTAGVVTTLAGSTAFGFADGTGTGASFYSPYYLAFGANGDMYVADTGNSVVRKVTTGGVVTTFAGSGAPGSLDGIGTNANLYYPQMLSIASNGDIYLIDPLTASIRKITPSGVVTTITNGLSSLVSVFISSNTLYWGNPFTINTVDARSETTFYSTVTTSIVPVAGGSLENPNVAAVLSAAIALRESETLAAKNSEYVLETQKARIELTNTMIKSNQVDNEKAAIQNRLKVALEGGKTAAEILGLQNQFAAKSIEASKLQFYIAALNAKYNAAATKGTSSPNFYSTLTESQTKLYTVSSAQKIDSASKDVSKAYIALNAAKTEQAAAQGVYDILTEEMNTAIRQGKTMAEAEAAQTALNAAGTELAKKTAATSYADKAYQAALQTYNDLQSSYPLSLYSNTFTMQDTEISTIMSTVTATTNLSVSSINAAKNNTLTRNLTQTYSLMMQMSTMVQQSQALYDNTMADFNAAIDQGKTLAEIQGLRAKLQDVSKMIVADKSDLINKTKAYTSSLLVATESQEAKAVLGAVAQAQAQITEGAKANALLTTLIDAKNLVFALNAEDAAAQSELLAANSAIQIATAGGDIPQEKYDAVLAASNKAAAIRNKLIKANTAAMNAQLNIDMNPNVEAINAIATTTYIKQNAKAESNTLMAQYNEAKTKEAATYAALDVANKTLETAAAAFDSAITSGTDLQTIQIARDAMNAAASQVNAANQAQTYAKAALNMAIENSKMSPIANALVVTQRVNDENVVAGAKTTTEQYKLNLLNADLTTASAAAAAAATAAAAARANLQASLATATSQEMVDLRSLADSTAAASAEAQTALDKMRRAVLEQEAVVDAATAAFEVTQAAVAANNIRNFLIFNGFLFQQSTDRYVLQSSLVPTTVTAGVSFRLDTADVVPLDLAIYDSSAEYTLGNLVTYPDDDGPKYMCLVSSQDPRGSSFTTITNKDPSAFPGLWIQTEGPALRYRSNTDFLISGATVQGSLIGVGITSGDLQGMQTLFTNSLANGNNTLLHGLSIFGPGIPSSTVNSPATITLTAYTNNRANLNITASKSFLAQGGNIYIKNGKTILAAAVLSYNTYVTALATAGFVPDVRIGHLTESFIDTTKLPATITAGTPFAVGTSTITPTDKGIYNAFTFYTTGDIVTDTYSSKYICLVGPRISGVPYTITGTAPVESPGTSLYWKVIVNNSWDSLTFNSSTDIPLQITGFGSLLWTSPTYPPNTVIQLDSNFLQGFTLFGSGVLQRTTATSSSYAFAGSNYSYKLNLDVGTSTNSNDTFYVKNGSSLFASSTTSKLCENLAVFMNNAATNALAVVNSTTDAQATSNYDSIVNPGISTLAGLYSSNTSFMSFINVTSTITGQCRSSANTHRTLLALKNSGQVSVADYNSAKTTNTTRFTAIQTRVTAAAAAINAQNAATANTNVSLITAEQANIIADPTLKVYLLASDYTVGSNVWNDRSGNGKNATVQVGSAIKSSAGNSIVLNGSTAWRFNDVNVGNTWTVSVWYKQVGTNDANGMILTQSIAGNARASIVMGKTNDVVNNRFNWFGFFNNSNSPTTAQLNSITLDTNVWVNLQMTWDGSNLRLYRDSLLVQTMAYSGVSASSGQYYVIGRREDNNQFINGEIGEVRVISRVLNATEIANAYMENLPSITGLKAWYTAADYSGTGAWADKSGSGMSATILFGTAAKNSGGNAVVFDGETSWTFPNPAVGNAWSVSVWYKKYATATGNSVILSQTQTDANNIYISDTNGNNTIAAGFKAMSDNTSRQTSGTPITQELWTNIQTTWDGTTLRTYLNGVLNASATPGGTSADSGTAYILGSDFQGGQSNFINGEIAEVRIYNRALIQAEVTSIYSTTVGPVTGVRAWFTASEYSGSGAWLDKSGYGNNATADRGTITLNADSNGLSLDGARSMIFSNTKVGNAWTITAWYRITGGIGTGASILTQTSSGTVNPNATLGYISGTNLSAGFANANTWTNGGTIALVTNVWTNIHATWDGENIRSYINGVLVSTVPSSATAVDNNLGYRIGASWNSNTSIIGELGELRMYNRPLTQAEITADYNSLAASYNVPVSIPSAISNLAIWLDGDDPLATGTPPAVNTTLTTWKDKSTNAVTPTRSGSSTGLVYSGTTNAITWSGSYLTMPNGSLPNGNSSFTYFFVVKTPNQNNIRLVNIGTANAVGTQLGLQYRGIDMDFFQPDLTTTVPAANQINIIAISYNSTTTRRSIFYNSGNSRNSHLLIPTYTSTPQNLPTTSQIIGANAGAGEVFSGNFYDVLVYSKDLTPAERQGVEGYLAWKWGVQSTLPSTHPYRNAPLAAPSAPTGLTGSMITESAFTVSWSGGAQATSYTYTLNGVATTPTTNNGVTSKSAIFSGLSPVTEYTVVVTAVNAIGSAASTSVSVTTSTNLNVNVGLRVWLDGNDAYSMTRTATNTISVWRDKSTFAITPTISGSSTGLTYSGTNAVSWSGSYLTMPNGSLPNGNSSFTYFFVVRTPNQNNTRLVNIGTSNSVGTQLGLHYRGSDMNFFQPDLTTTVPPANQTNIITISYNSTTRVRTIALNAATGATDTLGSALNLPTTSQIIGANTGGGEVFSGNFYELLVYSRALSTELRQKVEGFLAWKWGIQARLPSNHPYLNSAPPINTPNLQIYLRATNYSGSGAWIDESGTGHDATLENGTIAKNAQGNGIVLNGSTSWTFPNVNVSNKWTANVWFKNTANHAAGACIIVQKDIPYIFNCMIGDWGAWGNTTKVAGAFCSGPWSLGNEITLVNDVWTNIQVVNNGNQLTTYVNGTLIGSVTNNSAAVDSGLDYLIGRGWGGANYMVGEIGELRIYNRPLSESEVTAAYNESLSTFSS